jgi:hypothetical protein
VCVKLKGCDSCIVYSVLLFFVVGNKSLVLKIQIFLIGTRQQWEPAFQNLAEQPPGLCHYIFDLAVVYAETPAINNLHALQPLDLDLVNG